MVYGLVGLAADAVGFPIDYEKSLIEICMHLFMSLFHFGLVHVFNEANPVRSGTDTMEFLNGRRLLAQGDIVPMGKLLKETLMGHDCTPLDQVVRPRYDRTTDPKTLIENNGTIHKKVFEIRGHILGSITSIGPSARAIVAKMDAVSAWQSALLDNFSQDLGSATEESNLLLGAVLESDDSALDSMCHSQVSNVRWVPKLPGLPGQYGAVLRATLYRMLLTKVAESSEYGFVEKKTGSIDSTNAQLYQMRGLNDRELLPFKKGNRIAASATRRYNLLCCENQAQGGSSIELCRGFSIRGTDEDANFWDVFGNSRCS